MALPSRAAEFLERLEEFLQDEPMRPFFLEAVRHFLGSDDSPDPNTALLAQAYALHRHRDADGRGAVDRFLLAHGSRLTPEEREAFERMRASTFGFFEVESVERGRGLRLRRVGTDERFEVVEVGASQTLQVDWGIFVYLVPYRDHYEMVGSVISYPKELVYSIERTIRRDPEVVLQDISDPLWVRQNVEKLQNKPAPPENQLEAELVADQVFTELKLPWKVEELQARFQTMESCTSLLSELPPGRLRSKDELQRVMDALANLWNHTPRVEFNGLSPSEKVQERERSGRPSLPKQLTLDLMATIQREVDPAAFASDEERRQAIDAITERWRHEPQDELGGLTPDEFVAGKRPVTALDPATLPPPDRPLWTPESRLAKFRELLDAEKFEGALYVACRLARSGDPIPEELFGRFLDSVDGEILEQFWTKVCEGAPDSVRPALARLAVERIDLFRDEEALAPALRFLARSEPAKHEKLFQILLVTEDDPSVQDAAVEGLIRAGAPGADALVVRLIEESESFEQATGAVALSLIDGAVAAIPAAVRTFLDCLGHDSESDYAVSPLEDLPFQLEKIGLGSELSFRVSFSALTLSPSDEEDEEEDEEYEEEPLSTFFPVEDPAGARRASRILSPERAAHLGKLRRGRDDFPFFQFMVELVQEAIELASQENPAFAELGTRLGAFANALLDPPRIQALSQDDRDELSMLVGMILVKAIRGHDFRVEVPPVLGDRAKLLELLRVDEEWLGEDIVVRAASLLSEEDLLPIADSQDLYVAANGLTLLAAMRPEDYALRAVEHLHDFSLPADERLGWSARVATDAFLAAIHEGLTEKPWRGWEADVCSWLPIVATERAREYFRDHLDAFLDAARATLDVEDLVDAACVLADRDIALQVARSLETSGIRLGEIGSDRAELRYLLQALFDLTGVSEDVEAVLDRVAAAAIDRDPSEDIDELLGGGEDDDDVWDEEDDDEDTWDDADDRSSWFDGESPRRSILDSLSDEPYRRGAPKVGRNDPCPCGSGKKYKRCCGKGE